MRAGERDINAQSIRRGADSSDWKLRQQFPRESLSATAFKWTDDQPSVQVRALVLAGKTLFAAGPPDVIDERQAWRLPDDPEVQAKLQQQADALEGKLGGRLWAVSAADGKPVARYDLDAPPVFDGMAAARDRLFLTTMSGQVVCLGPDGAAELRRADDEPLQSIADEPATKPAGWQPPEVSKNEDFVRVRGGRVVESPLGYRLRGEAAAQDAVALKKLPQPLKQQVVLRAKFRPADSSEGMLNGFLAFGDGPKDEQLVKCGVRFRMKTGVIVEGSVQNGKAASKPLAVGPDETIEVTVSVDLEAQKVSMTAGGQTVAAPLSRKLSSVTHVGYCVLDAATDFSPIEVSESISPD